jgi:hypothetical protein
MVVGGFDLPQALEKSSETALAGYQRAVGRHNDGVQQPDLLNAGREPGDIAEIATVAPADP